VAFMGFGRRLGNCGARGCDVHPCPAPVML
jgi:hypothetical protein